MGAIYGLCHCLLIDLDRFFSFYSAFFLPLNPFAKKGQNCEVLAFLDKRVEVFAFLGKRVDNFFSGALTH